MCIIIFGQIKNIVIVIVFVIVDVRNVTQTVHVMSAHNI